MAKTSSSSAGPRIFSTEVKTFRNSTSLRCSVHLNWKLLLLLLLTLLALAFFAYKGKHWFKRTVVEGEEEEEKEDKAVSFREDESKLGGLFSGIYFDSGKKINNSGSSSSSSHFDPLKIPFPLPPIAERPDVSCHWHVAYLQNLTSLVWRSATSLEATSQLKRPELLTTSHQWLLPSLATLKAMNLSAEYSRTTLKLLATTTPSLSSALEGMSLSAAVTRVLAPLLSNLALAERSQQKNGNNSSNDQQQQQLMAWLRREAKAVGTTIHLLSKQLFSLPKRILSRRPQPASVNYRLGEVVHLLEYLYYDAVMTTTATGSEENSGGGGGYSEEMKDTLMRLTRNHHHSSSHHNLNNNSSSSNKSADFTSLRSRLYMSSLNQSGWTSARSSLFGPSAPFYWTLINTHCLLNGNGHHHRVNEEGISSSSPNLLYLQLLTSALDDALDARLLTTNVDGWTYAQSINFFSTAATASEPGTHQLDGQMESSACGLGGLLALGAWAMNQTGGGNQRKSAQYLGLAVNLTETCHELTQRSAAVASGGNNASLVTTTTGGLLPDRALFLPDGSIQLASTVTHLHDDLAKSYLLLYRVTGDVRYRRYAWELTRALVRAASPGQGRHSPLRGEHIATTLRYLHMTLNSREAAPLLGELVLNQLGQPLPVLTR